MKTSEMTETQRAAALVRHERAEEIIVDYEAQHDFELPEPWREAIPRLLLQGLGDPELHLIFETLMRVEYDAGRLAESKKT
jgi:hypothetical protein